MSRIRKFLFRIFVIFILFIIVLVWFILTGVGIEEKDMKWGVTFSVPQARYLELDWQSAYISLLDDLQVKNFRLIAAWDALEPEKDKFDFSDIDWQLNELQMRHGHAIVTLGLKVPRWPECHVPKWAEGFSKQEQQDEIVKYIKKSVQHLASSEAIVAWQIENEPFLSFGQCPWGIDANFLEREIVAVKSIDPRPVIVTGSGEWATLFREANLGDIVGTTLYQKVYFGPLDIFLGYPFSSASYARKVWLIREIFNKDVIDVELQAEPWSENGLLGASKEKNDKTFTLTNFKENIDFAKHTGHKEAYLWGSEWWYYMKELGHSEYWEEAKKLFQKQ